MSKLVLPCPNSSRWYTLSVYPGKEADVKLELEKCDFIDRVLVPCRTIVEMKKERRKEWTKRLYPGYVFALLKLNETNWQHLMNKMYGVLDILRDKYHPIPLKRSEVYSLIESIGVERRQEKEIDFIVGETIEVTSGPFSNFQGKIEQVNESKQTVRVIINIFGRVTPLELDVLQVKKIES